MGLQVRNNCIKDVLEAQIQSIECFASGRLFLNEVWGL